MKEWHEKNTYTSHGAQQKADKKGGGAEFGCIICAGASVIHAHAVVSAGAKNNCGWVWSVGGRKWLVNFRLLPHTFENKMREEASSSGRTRKP